MYHLRGWKPRISALDEGRYSLKIRAKLECDDCSGEFTIETEGSTVSLDGAGSSVSMGHEIGQVLQRRICPKCGTLSRLDETDTEKLRKEAERVIATRWINDQLKK